jgi:hypothetical protein
MFIKSTMHKLINFLSLCFFVQQLIISLIQYTTEFYKNICYNRCCSAKVNLLNISNKERTNRVKWLIIIKTKIL